jgi:putative glutamine amidotransferase
MPPKADPCPRIGVPWRTVEQERAGDTRYNRDYLQAVKDAGGEPVQVSLLLSPDKLASLAGTLDALVLPGSPADVNPELYSSKPHGKTAPPDVKRENTDIALLKNAFPAGKPVLAICYGTQLLNVHLGGTLMQDIPTETAGKAAHGSTPGKIKHEHDRGEAAALHAVRLKNGRLARLAGRATVRVNSSHHQSILHPGRGLRVTALAPDGVIEAVEWIAGPAWVVGVQWHPERMCRNAKRSGANRTEGRAGDAAFARALFTELVAEARAAAGRRRGNLRGRDALHIKRETRKRRSR